MRASAAAQPTRASSPPRRTAVAGRTCTGSRSSSPRPGRPRTPSRSRLPQSYQGPPVYSAGAAVGFYGPPPRLPQDAGLAGCWPSRAESPVPAAVLDQHGCRRQQQARAWPADRRAVRRRLPGLLLLPAGGRAAEHREHAADAAARRHRRGVPARRDRLAGDPVGGHPGPAGGTGRLAAVDRPAERADGSPRHRRAGRAGHRVQRDGRQPPGEARRAARTCRRSSGSSSPTSRTSCGRR